MNGNLVVLGSVLLRSLSVSSTAPDSGDVPAGGECGLLPRLHVLKIDPVVCVDAVDRLCSRLKTMVDSTGSGEQTAGVVLHMSPLVLVELVCGSRARD